MERERPPRTLDEVEPSTIYRSVQELDYISDRLRLMGPLILVATLVNVGVLFWAIGVYVGPYGYSPGLAISSILIAMATIAALGFFEALRKRGDAIFQEVSDELQWHIGRVGSRGTPYTEGPATRPVLEARVVLRTFSAAAELPLVPGRFGGATYALLNLLVAASAVSLLGR